MRKNLTILLICFSIYGFSQESIPNISIKSINGKSIQSKDLILSGQVTVISFWATWCKPCLEELDAISDEFDLWKQQVDFKFIAISVDDSRSSSRVNSFVKGKGWPFDFYLDTNQELKRAMNITEIPFMIVIDKKGRIAFRHISYIQGYEQTLFEEIKKVSNQ